MNGRREKARQGQWNGGFAPYGYDLVNGKLVIAPKEAETVRKIFEIYSSTPKGADGVAKELNLQGYEKVQRQNGTSATWIASTITRILDNPVYIGKIAFGRRSKEKIKGTRNQYHMVTQDDYILTDGHHEPIISNDLWDKVQEKRIRTGHRCEPLSGKEKTHALSGILKCPECGGPLHTSRSSMDSKNRSKGTYYYYVCYNSRRSKTVKCTYRKMVREDVINYYIEGLVPELLNSPKLLPLLKSKLTDTSKRSEYEEILSNYESTKKEITQSTHILEEEIDNMPISTPGYQVFRKKNNERLQKLYAQIEELEERIEATTKMLNDLADDSASLALFEKGLVNYERLFRNITEEEKKEFFQYFFKSITVYPDFENSSQIVKSVQIYFRAYKNQNEIKQEILKAKGSKEIIDALSDESQVKTVYVDIDLHEFGLDKLLESRAKEALTLTYNPRSRRRGPYNSHKVTYKKIKAYVKEKYDLNVHTAAIAEMKRRYGCDMENAYNLKGDRTPGSRYLTQIKEEAITDALINFGVISPDHEPQNYDVGEVTYKMIEEYVKKNFNMIPRSKNIAEVKRMHGIKMLNTRTVEDSASSKRTTTKEMTHAIEMALVYFKIIDEGQVTEM